jgi:hypothetical protein
LECKKDVEKDKGADEKDKAHSSSASSVSGVDDGGDTDKPESLLLVDVVGSPREITSFQDLYDRLLLDMGCDNSHAHPEITSFTQFYDRFTVVVLKHILHAANEATKERQLLLELLSKR